MSIFSRIKDAIFGKKPAPQVTETAARGGSSSAPAPAAPQPVSEVDVEHNLGAMAGADALNWRTSIVDLMKLLDIDSSYDNRKELAHELGDTNYSGSAEDNIALHKAVMRELAKNGGRVPSSLTD